MNALVLSGGGARGAYEAGAASALARVHTYDLICGTSIGAINAAFVATGRADRLESFWCDVLPARVRKLLPHLPGMRHMLADLGELGRGSRWENARHLAHALSDMRFLKVFVEQNTRSTTSRIAELAHELAGLLDVANMQCGLVAAATNVTLGMPTAFYANCDPNVFSTPSHRAEHVASIDWQPMSPEGFVWAILASAALPGLLAPISLESRGMWSSYADGGLVHNSPIGLAIDAGATDITIVFVDSVSSVARACPEHTVGRMACAVFVLWQQRVLDYELRLIQATNELIRYGASPGKSEIHVKYVRPERALMLDVLGFEDSVAIARAFQQGALDAEKVEQLS